MKQNRKTFSTIVTISGEDAEVDRLAELMDLGGNAAFCRLVPMPAMVSVNSMGSSELGDEANESNSLNWSDWQAENWGPVGGDYRLNVIAFRYSKSSDRKLLRFSFLTDDEPFNEEFLCAVSRLARSSVMIVFCKDIAERSMTYTTLCGGFVMTSGDLDTKMKPIDSPDIDLLKQFRVFNANSGTNPFQDLHTDNSSDQNDM